MLIIMSERKRISARARLALGHFSAQQKHKRLAEQNDVLCKIYLTSVSDDDMEEFLRLSELEMSRQNEKLETFLRKHSEQR